MTQYISIYIYVYKPSREKKKKEYEPWLSVSNPGSMNKFPKYVCRNIHGFVAVTSGVIYRSRVFENGKVRALLQMDLVHNLLYNTAKFLTRNLRLLKIHI